MSHCLIRECPETKCQNPGASLDQIFGLSQCSVPLSRDSSGMCLSQCPPGQENTVSLETLVHTVWNENLIGTLYNYAHFSLQCDLNRDGKITQEEFLKAGLSIAELFEFESDEWNKVHSYNLCPFCYFSRVESIWRIHFFPVSKSDNKIGNFSYLLGMECLRRTRPVEISQSFCGLLRILIWTLLNLK